MTAIIAEGGDPAKFGFFDAKVAMEKMRLCIVLNKNQSVIWKHWSYIQEAIIENKEQLTKTLYWKDIKWMLDVDFHKPEKIKMPLKYQITHIDIHKCLPKFKVYRALRKIKRMMFK